MSANRFQYTLTEQDFLDFQLFSSTQSRRHVRQRNTGRVFILLAGLMGIYAAIVTHSYIWVIFGALLLAWGLFYTAYYKQRLKTMYAVHNREQFSARFGEVCTVEIRDGWIRTSGKHSEFNADLSYVQRIDETEKHFFIRFLSGYFIFFSKEHADMDSGEIRGMLEDAGLRVNIVKNNRGI